MRSILPSHLRARHSWGRSLLGYSWGGLLAFEAGRQWMQQENALPFIGLIGTDAPVLPTTGSFKVQHFLRWLPHWCYSCARDWRNFRSRLVRGARRIKRTGLGGLQTPYLPEWAGDPISRGHAALVLRYAPQVGAPLPLQLFREELEFSRRGHPLTPFETKHHADGGWSAWARQSPTVHWLATRHGHVLRPPAVGEFAAKLAAALTQHYR